MKISNILYIILLFFPHSLQRNCSSTRFKFLKNDSSTYRRKLVFYYINTYVTDGPQFTRTPHEGLQRVSISNSIDVSIWKIYVFINVFLKENVFIAKMYACVCCTLYYSTKLLFRFCFVSTFATCACLSISKEVLFF